MADVASNLYSWSTSAASNSPSDSTTIGAGLADNLQEIQKVVRQDLAHKGADIASATTTDLGAVIGLMHDITGTTTITGFGTVSAGIWKILKFEGALTLTHNSTSLILPSGANITTANGDVAIFMSEGSGNWRCLSYMPAALAPVAATTSNIGPVELATQAEYSAGTASRVPTTDLYSITLGTEAATTSGTTVSFGSIPAGVRRININFVGISTNSTSALTLQIGDSGGLENSGYSGGVGQRGAETANSTSFLLIQAMVAANTFSGQVTLCLEDASDFTWTLQGVICNNSSGLPHMSAGSKSLSAELTQLEISTVSGDTFDAGAINISYER